MDKISSILPSSARITAVDMKEGGAVRPGVPSFGRTEGVSGRSSVDRTLMKDTASAAAQAQGKQLNWRAKDLAQAEVANSVTRNFFGHSRDKVEVSAKDEIENNNQERESATYGPGTTGKNNGGKMLASARDIEDVTPSKPTGFHNEEVTRAIQVRNFHPEVGFDEDEAKGGITEPSFFGRQQGASSGSNSTSTSRETPRAQPEGLYPKGSFIDRSA